MNTMKDIQEKLALGQIKERVFALFCLTVIAIMAMFHITDPENIVINVIVGICSFTGGVAVGAMGKRKADSQEEKPLPDGDQR